MRLRALLPLVLTGVAITPPGSAHAAPPTTGPDGVKCGVELEGDPSPDAGVRDLAGQIFGGPLVVTQPGGAAEGTLTCRITDGGGTHARWTTPGGFLAMHSTNGVVLDSASVVIEAEPLTADLHLCTSFEYESGASFYWDAGTKAWSTSDGVPCAPIEMYATSDSAIHDPRMTPCPVFTMVPVIASTLRNIWGCNGNAPLYGRWIGGYALPDA